MSVNNNIHYPSLVPSLAARDFVRTHNACLFSQLNVFQPFVSQTHLIVVGTHILTALFNLLA